MSVMGVIIFIICLLVMLAGLAGTVLPILPGIPIIWVAMLGYGFYDGWAQYGLTGMLVTGFLVALSVAVDQLASMVGAKKFGASRAGMIGSIVGGLVGLLAFPPLGIIPGTFLGAMACELAFGGRNFGESMASGTGALIGFLAGSLFKFMLGTALIAWFLYAVIF